MTPTNVTPLHNRQRNPLDFSLSPAEERRRDSILRSFWVRIVEGFPCRPEPRSAWDRAADQTEARWKKLLTPIRAAVASAVFNGDDDLTNQTLENADAFFDACKADVRSLVPPKEEESLTALALLETECAGEKSVEEMRLVSHASPTEAERAIGIISKDMSSMARLLDWCQRQARQPSMRIASR